MLEPITIDTEDFDSVVICAIRYCIGRQTYMPSIVIDFVTPLLPILDDKTLKVIQSDVKSAGNYGDELIDKPLWMQFLADVEREICEQKEVEQMIVNKVTMYFLDYDDLEPYDAKGVIDDALLDYEFKPIGDMIIEQKPMDDDFLVNLFSKATLRNE